MKSYECDVVVVGAGPGGSMAARYCAEGGLDTILIEKKAEIGAPLRCAEGVSKKWLDEVKITPDPTWIRADMKGAIILVLALIAIRKKMGVIKLLFLSGLLGLLLGLAE